jgi:AmmeMemoRadiSam system protein B
MAQPLPRLRLDLDFMPSPVPDRPGLVMRDPFHYSDATLIIPPPLVALLEMFDGRHTEMDLREGLASLTGDVQVSELLNHLVGTLSESGFFEDEVYGRMKEERHGQFARAARREPAHSGSGYPREPGELRAAMVRYLDGAAAAAPREGLVGVAAPHVSIDGGWECYREAYAGLGPDGRDRVFVILGTSHYGASERFGLTRKPFLTPLGEAVTDAALVDELEREGGPAVHMEDYCHSVEHSIEFQVVFLQQVFGPQVRILPVLCGPFGRSLMEGGRPEDDDNVRRFFDALGALAARERRRLFWVMGVDMAHMGRRYHDPFSAHAGAGKMEEVERQDRERIGRIAAGDPDGFWSAVQENHDPLKWCGSSPFYTFLKAAPGVRGELLRYQQWNIDPQSVVSFGALAFR